MKPRREPLFVVGGPPALTFDADLHDRLLGYALGILSPAEMEATGALVAAVPVLATEVAAMGVALSVLAERLTPVPPPPEARARLMRALADAPAGGS